MNEINIDNKSNSYNLQTKFLNQHTEIIKRIKTINFSDKETQFTLKNINSIINKSDIEDTTKIDFISKTSQLFSSENIKNKVDENYDLLLNKINKQMEPMINTLLNIVSNQKQLESEYQSIIKIVSEKEVDINEIIDYYWNYLTTNKNFLIRNEILKTFLDKIIITKEDKDNLLNKNLFDENFFKLIRKMHGISQNIIVIDRNNEKFSKNLIFSIKENFNIMDDLLNEKIVLYLKNLFRNLDKDFNKEHFNNMKNTLYYLIGKDNYLNFILKEYTQMRRKVLDDIMKKKYLKLNKLDDIFQLLIEDFEYHFLKEFILLFSFFSKENSIFNKHDEDVILLLLNNKQCSGLENLLKKVQSIKDFNFYVAYLNPILYSLEELFYENINHHKNLNNSLSEIYKITILSYFYQSKIQLIFKENNLQINENLNLFSMIVNYKKSFSKILSKITNDTYKNLVTLQKNFKKNLNEDNIISNDNTLIKTISHLVDEYNKIFNYFKTFCPSENTEILSPKTHSSFIFLIDFFNIDPVKNENNLNLLLKILNLMYLVYTRLDGFDVDLTVLKECFDRTEASVVKIIVESILKTTKFEENLNNNISHEQTINLIEDILEKSQFYFISLDSLSDYHLRELIIDKVKIEIIKMYSEFLNKEENLNLSFISKDEFKNYLDIL